MFISDSLAHWARENPTGIAFADDQLEVTFSELDSQVRKTATYLADLGIARGEKITTVLSPYHSWVFTLALHMLGAVTSSQNVMTSFPPGMVPSRLISYQQHPMLPLEKNIVLNDAIFSEINTSAPLTNVPGYASISDIARTFSTSGTTGTPKELAVTFLDISKFPYQKSSYDYIGEEPILSIYPFASKQTYRWSLKCLNRGITFYSVGAFDQRLVNLLTKYPIHTITGSPVQVATLLDAYKESVSPTVKVKKILLSGSKPSEELVREIKLVLGCKVYDFYGSAEGGYIASRELSSDPDQGAIINSNVILQIVDEQNEVLPDGSVGQVRYQRQGMIGSYHQNSEATSEFYVDGFFYPGDLGYINKNGNLVLQGRSSEIINLGGVKISPEKVDQIAIHQIGVRDCAAFSIPGPSGVHEVGIAIVAGSDFEIDVFRKVMSQKSPAPLSLVILADVIPRNSNGKISRSSLTQAVATRLTKPEPTTAE